VHKPIDTTNLTDADALREEVYILISQKIEGKTLGAKVA